jgi:putative sterol carrier protein
MWAAGLRGAMKFPSGEWADAFRTALNQNSAYQEAAQAWEGDILFLVRPADPSAPAPGIQLQLAHGQCSGATFHADARSLFSEFVYEGTQENWGRLLRKEVDPVKAILDGTFKIRGNLAKAMRFTRAAKELVETAASVPGDA